VTGQRWRLVLLVVAGLAGLAAVRLLILGNWSYRCPDGTANEACDGPLVGVGAAGSIGFWPLMAVVVGSCLGMIGAIAGELYVRRRTERRRPRSEYERLRP
jgi:hypothetical protein